MQRILSLLFVAIISIICAGCGGDDATGPGNSKGSMSAKVSSASWSATTVQSTYSSGVLAIGGSQINGSQNKQINIQGLISAPGTYQLGLVSPITANYTEADGPSAAQIKTFSCTSGTLKVDELSATGAKGSFALEMREQGSSGAGTATRSITEGTFNVTF